MIDLSISIYLNTSSYPPEREPQTDTRTESHKKNNH